ncbi:ABC transporter permease/substrate-binding protein [Companilactobacillus mishanensis]|uniref:ABC transporter permease/substrate-binding protein n=1 Tax=Companilactobacillus mishanensis TaxID=2486008 RepID=A0ABW9P9M6_9LACO|nr:ABC transporter permease/substrate-binding protein [Companilactobacillus mishanensis]MQS45975.1 ABC transporter permease/substrate-binding protein [Companilactobacillus mishanensis]
MNNFVNILQTQHKDILNSLGQHLSISLISLLIAAVIAIPLAIWLRRYKKAAEIVLQITSVFQTIPSLALLGILIPIVGIGTVPAVIALVVYAVMPIFQNTYSGFTSIDASLEEAADAFGLSKWHKLIKIELPLAMPLIVSGLRIAMVLIIGTATLAALIGAGGLGTYILLGIETNNNALLLIGAILSALLALVFSALIRFLGKLSFKKIMIVLAGIIVLFGGWGIYSVVSKPLSTITIAGKMGSEPEILINMYKDLIQEENPKQKVEIKPNFGTTNFLYKALKSGQIDVYPEFTGTVMESLVKVQNYGHNPDKIYKQGKSMLKKQDNLDYLSPMEYQNGYALVVTKEFAKKYNLKTIQDLAAVQDQVKAGFDIDFYNQKDGYQGIKKAYNLDFGNVNTMQPSIRYKAIANGKVNLVDGYTTDPQVQKYHLVVLKDNKSFFPPYQGAPLVTDKAIKEHPGLKKALNKLSGKISVKDMQKMNYQVTFQHKKAKTVAHDYLDKHNLIKE